MVERHMDHDLPSVDLFFNHIANRGNLPLEAEEAPEILVTDLTILPDILDTKTEEVRKKAGGH